VAAPVITMIPVYLCCHRRRRFYACLRLLLLQHKRQQRSVLWLYWCLLICWHISTTHAHDSLQLQTLVLSHIHQATKGYVS